MIEEDNADGGGGGGEGAGAGPGWAGMEACLDGGGKCWLKEEEAEDCMGVLFVLRGPSGRVSRVGIIDSG